MLLKESSQKVQAEAPAMPRERITRRQKDLSRLLREKRQSHKSRLDAGKKRK